MSIEDIAGYRQKTIMGRIDALQARTLPALVPLYRRGVRRTPELLGTGFVLAAGPRRFLVTAAHVVLDHAVDQLYCGLGSSLVTVPATRHVAEPDVGDGSDGRADVLFWELPAAHRGLLPPGGAISVLDCDMRTEAPTIRGPDSDFVVIGYPCSRQPKQPKSSGELQLHPFVFATHPYPSGDVRDVHLGETLLLAYDKSDTHTLEGRKEGPDLFGVSGGAVWYYPAMMDPAPGRPMLAGVAIRWRRASPPGIRVTPIVFVLQGIAERLEGRL